MKHLTAFSQKLGKDIKKLRTAIAAAKLDERYHYWPWVELSTADIFNERMLMLFDRLSAGSTAGPL